MYGHMSKFLLIESIFLYCKTFILNSEILQLVVNYKPLIEFSHFGFSYRNHLLYSNLFFLHFRFCNMVVPIT